MLGALRRRLGEVLPLVLVGLALTGFLLSSAGLPHSHAPDRPGLYNEEHDLSYLGAFSGAGLVSEASSTWVPVVVVALAIAGFVAGGSAPRRRHADFRAPPLR